VAMLSSNQQDPITIENPEAIKNAIALPLVTISSLDQGLQSKKA